MTTSLKHSWVPIILILYVLANASAQNQQGPASPSDKLAEYFFWKCQNQTKTTAAFDKLYVDTVEFKKYLQYAFTFLPSNKKTFCDSERRQLEKRIVEVANDLKPCLVSEEKYLSDFLRDSFKEFLHFLCHNDGEHVTAFFSARSEQCRNSLQNDQTNELASCFNKIFKPVSGKLKKKEVCDDLTTAKKCFAEILEHRCPSYGPYKVLNEEFFKYLSKPCSGCALYLNSLILIASVMFSLMFSH